MKSRIKIVVHKQGGKYYATRCFPESSDFAPTNVIFSIEKEINPDEFPKLEDEAKEEARRRGIDHVINLD